MLFRAVLRPFMRQFDGSAHTERTSFGDVDKAQFRFLASPGAEDKENMSTTHSSAEEWPLAVERRIDRGEPASARSSRDAKTLANLIKLHREDVQEAGGCIGRSKAASLTLS
jgi:hypothetical protein